MKNLSLEEKELLAELTVSDTWQALIKLLDLVVERHEHAVLNQDLSQKDGAKELIRLKSRLDGARALAVAIKGYKDATKTERT